MYRPTLTWQALFFFFDYKPYFYDTLTIDVNNNNINYYLLLVI